MPIFIRGLIKIVENSSFKDARTGQPVPYYTTYVQDPEGKLVKLGAKEDYSEHINEPVIITATMRSDRERPNLFRVVISDVKVDK